jgi:ribosomal RNA assembly protein
MEHILIPQKRASALRRILPKVSKQLDCKIELLEGNEVTINGDGYAEYNARNVIQAFGRGFPINEALKLLDEQYFFKYINLKDILRNEDQIKRIKARIIGTNGKTKGYIEAVSEVVLSIYGNTVGMIGTTEQLETATGALQVLVEGGTHKKAYRIMEGIRRKHRGAI